MIVFLERYKTNFTLYSDKDIIFTESGRPIYCLFIPLFLLYRPCLTFSFCYEGRIGDAGADPGILVRGGVELFFFKAMESGGRFNAPIGSRATPWRRPQGRSPRRLLSFSDFRSEI